MTLNINYSYWAGFVINLGYIVMGIIIIACIAVFGYMYISQEFQEFLRRRRGPGG